MQRYAHYWLTDFGSFMTVHTCTMSSGLRDLMTESCEYGSFSQRLEEKEKEEEEVEEKKKKRKKKEEEDVVEQVRSSRGGGGVKKKKEQEEDERERGIWLVACLLA